MIDTTNERFREYVPEGWRALFDELLINLEKVQPGFKIIDAKQKFGELRVYLKSGSSEAFQLIDAATRSSRVTCEQCGQQGALRSTNGYVQSLCDEHAKPKSVVLEKSPIVASFRATGGKLTRPER